jgi:hypothetical protein
MKRHIKISILVAAILAALITGCIQLHEIVMPSNIETNSEFEVHVKGSINPQTDYGPEGMAIAMLVPKAWDVANTAKLYLSTSGLNDRFGIADISEEPMVSISDVEFPKATGPNAPYAGMTWQQAYTVRHGNMGNVGGEMEWLVFKNGTTKVKTNGDDQSKRVELDVKIVFKTTDEPIKCTMAFEYAGELEGWDGEGTGISGFKANIKTAECKVGDGTVNYLEYPLTSTTPTMWRYGDFFAVNFTTKTGDNETALFGEKEIYMCGAVYLEDGRKVTIDRKDNFTKMDILDETTFQKYIFPTHYFGLPAKTKITEMYLYFTNKDGSKVVSSNDFEDGFFFRQQAR